MCELTEVMRQQGEPLLTDILNAARVGDLSDRDIEILNRRKGDIENVSADATVLFLENSPKDSFKKSLTWEFYRNRFRNFCYWLKSK